MTYKDLRKRARDNLRNNWPLSVAVAAVAVLLGGLGTRFLPNWEVVLYEGPLFSDWTVFQAGDFRLTLKDGANGLLAFLLGGALELGYCRFLLKQHDTQDMEFKDLFSQFDRYGTGFAQAFLRGLYCFLWGLLFTIPGIVKSYAYAMTPYILTDHPDLTPSEAIARSQQMMDGHKGELFVLHLTFIGWSLLAGAFWNLGYLLVNPYRKAAETAFYRELLTQEQAQRITYTVDV